MNETINTDGITIAKESDLQVMWIKPDEVYPNDWNPNEMDVFQYAKLKTSLERQGWRIPMFVRQKDGSKGYEIIDGEHRKRAAIELGKEFMERYKGLLPIINYGHISREQAMELTVVLNRISGWDDVIKLSELVKELDGAFDRFTIEQTLPFNPELIDSLVDLLDYDPNQFDDAEGEPFEDEEGWINFICRVPVDVLPIVEKEFKRIEGILKFKKGFDKEVVNGIVLKAICNLSARKPLKLCEKLLSKE